MEMETFSLSEACGGGELPDEDEDGEGARRKIWGTVDGLTPAARYVFHSCDRCCFRLYRVVLGSPRGGGYTRGVPLPGHVRISKL